MKTTANPNFGVSPCVASIVYPLGYYIVLPLFFGRIEITGQENIPKTGPVILAPTHRSRWDALILGYATGRYTSGRDLRFMVTIDEYNKPIQGWFIRQMGGFPVDTQRPDFASLNYSVELLRSGEMVVIFPEGAPGEEGEVFRDNKIHPLKRGLALIALETELKQPDCKTKILPISLKYSEPYPSWGTDVAIKIGSPINVADYQTNSLRKSSQRLTGHLEAALKDLHEKADSSDPVVVAIV
jgi:1-acyl-sn-glycerol-3-phosphate acyltransferase